MEILAKLMPDGHLPTEDNVFNERLMRAAHEFSAQVVVPGLASAGLVPESNPLFGPRLGSLIPKALIEDMIEFSGELSQSGKASKREFLYKYQLDATRRLFNRPKLRQGEIFVILVDHFHAYANLHLLGRAADDVAN